jgi:MFS family permease
MLRLTRYQWLVLLAAWLGWGFDVFDGLLFNYVSPICVPNLLGLDPHDPATKPAVVFWTGTLTSLLLVGWGLGSATLPKLADLFTPELRPRTLSGLLMAMIALVTWWSCNAFLPTLASFMADEAGRSHDRVAFITTATTWFNLGGLIGTLLTVPVAERLGRRTLFLSYFGFSALSLWLTFGLPLEATSRLYLMGLVGLPVFGIFGCFTFYLPELFPARLRGTGAGFCYNTGRFVTACFPFLVSVLVTQGNNPFDVVKWIALVPAVGIALVMLGVAVETRGQTLPVA